MWFALTIPPNLYIASQLTGDGVEGLSLMAYTVAGIFASFANGLQYGTINAVFMGLTNRAVAGTQFTGYMALSNLANTYSSAWQGTMAGSSGYGRTLQLDGLIAIVPILLLVFVAPRRGAEEGESTAA